MVVVKARVSYIVQPSSEFQSKHPLKISLKNRKAGQVPTDRQKIGGVWLFLRGGAVLWPSYPAIPKRVAGRDGPLRYLNYLRYLRGKSDPRKHCGSRAPGIG
jgi:hypothetical protein